MVHIDPSFSSHFPSGRGSKIKCWWRRTGDERIAELEAESARKDVELAARDARIFELEGQVATLSAQMPR